MANKKTRRARGTTVDSLLHELATSDDERVIARLRPLPTGFEPLDEVLGGGLRPGTLTLVGGAPGTGKTIAVMQWARNLARAGHEVVVVCYEHDEHELLVRLIGLEAASLGKDDAEQVMDAVNRSTGGDPTALLDLVHSSGPMLDNVSEYGQRIRLVQGVGSHTDLDEVRDLTESLPGGDGILIIDYLQKVHVPGVMDEGERVTRVSEGLKDLAMERDLVVISVVAADRDGLEHRRLQLHHLRGSSSLAFEADVALLLNEKRRAVSKVHLAYDPVHAATFANWTVFSIAKNRGGVTDVHMEFRKDFTRFRFEEKGGMVQETLVEEHHFEE